MIHTPARIRYINWYAVGAVIHRTIIRWRVWGLFMLTQNVGVILMFVLILKITQYTNPVYGTSVGVRIDLILPGLLLFCAFNQAFTDASAGLIYDKMEKVIEDLYIAPLNAHDVILSTFASGLLSVIIFSLPVWPLLVLFDLPLWPANGAVTLMLFVLLSLFAVIAGLLTGLFAMRWDHFSFAYTFVFLPLAALSGFFFPLTSLPAQLVSILAWNPLALLVEGFRVAWLGTPPIYDAGISIISIPILSAACYFLAHRLITRRLMLL